MLEKDIERYLARQVRKEGGLALKFVSPGRAGVPDRLILLPGGQVCFAELKSPWGKPTARQKMAHQELRELGFAVFVPDSKAGVDALLRQLRGCVAK